MKHLKMVESKENRLLGMLSKSIIMEIKDVGLLKCVFDARVRWALHYGSELWVKYWERVSSIEDNRLVKHHF